jgi:hypothetical protein
LSFRHRGTEETRRRGDKEKGDKETREIAKVLLVSPSPCLLVSVAAPSFFSNLSKKPAISEKTALRISC